MYITTYKTKELSDYPTIIYQKRAKKLMDDIPSVLARFNPYFDTSVWGV